MRELRAVLLASVSPRRRELLSSLGLRVLVMPTNADESEIPGATPVQVARAHADAKAAAVLTRIGSNVMVAADTVVDVDGASLRKPSGPIEAAAMLRVLSGREHLVHTAFVVVDGTNGRRHDGISTTKVRFAELTEDAIEAYVASGEPLDKAGGYGIQGRGAALVAAIDGDFYTVMGFPLGAFVRALPALGLTLPRDAEAVAVERGRARA